MHAAVLELQQLHEELDVRQRATSELQVELRIFAWRDAFALDTRLHAPHLAPVVLGEGASVDDVVDERAETRAHRGISRHDARLRQGLTLPGEAPAAVVGLVPREGPRERALVPFWPETSVDAEGLALRGGRADL